ncbi:RND efflux system, outer membrane lipoprotein, NodT family [Mariniradius saccharolyticus AK6]|uniref:RND efflux system, outer membrane lipoprotein, NodT family n=1 Tax=Mariniradius saccharolyticus AK6 TaxID=1239962 RepID=M7YCV3_9BACT|nr:RND efflux system, outer membrane lipoprotein, NodT family [Mariniradius saccharolyticus AK6]
MIGLFLVFFLIQACKTTKVSQPQDSDILPTTFDDDRLDTTSNHALLNWEQFFEDEKLRDLITIALANNQDNLKTLEKIRIAQANLRVAKVGWLPEFNAVAGASRRKFGEYTMDGVGNFDTNLSGNVPEDKRIPDPYRDFIVGANFNWEIDVWGKYRNLNKAAASRYLASQEMANYVKTWLISQVAVQYYSILGLEEEIRILDENIRLQELAVGLSKDLKVSGKSNQLAVDQFEALLLNFKALVNEKQRMLRSAELQMAALLGNYQTDYERSSLEEAFVEPEILRTGLPTDLLQLRPDVRMAERELMAANADIFAARAAFFPSFNLFGMAGFNAFDFSKLFFNPASAVYQFGAGLAAPLFNRNRIRMQFEAANASQRIAWYDYEQTVLRSYIEVLDLVNQFQTLDEQVENKSNEVLVQKRSVENSNTMFTVGYANYLDVLNAQSRALQAEIELIELKTQQLQARVNLYKALGGGWTVSN